jgi:hypothetical protein
MSDNLHITCTLPDFRSVFSKASAMPLDRRPSIGAVRAPKPISRAGAWSRAWSSPNLIRLSFDRRLRLIGQPEAALDAVDYEVAHVAAIEPAGGRHPGDRFAIAAIEGEGDA